jgi:hypothetical protein
MDRRPEFYVLRDAVPKRHLSLLYEEKSSSDEANKTVSMIRLPAHIAEHERVLSQILNEIIHIDMTNLSGDKIISRLVLTNYRIILFDNKEPYISLALGMIRDVNVNAKFKGEHLEESSQMAITCHNGIMLTLRAPARVAAEKFEWIATEIQFCLGENCFGRVQFVKETKKKKRVSSKYDPKEMIGGELVPGSICGAAKSAHDLLSQRKNRFSASKFYDARKEYERIGAFRQGLWRVSRANHKYALCETYPSFLVVPSKITDKQLHAAASYRSKKRLPVRSIRVRSARISFHIITLSY